MSLTFTRFLLAAGSGSGKHNRLPPQGERLSIPLLDVCLCSLFLQVQSRTAPILFNLWPPGDSLLHGGHVLNEGRCVIPAQRLELRHKLLELWIARHALVEGRPLFFPLPLDLRLGALTVHSPVALAGRYADELSPQFGNNPLRMANAKLALTQESVNRFVVPATERNHVT
jgi:hypothetical protein